MIKSLFWVVSVDADRISLKFSLSLNTNIHMRWSQDLDLDLMSDNQIQLFQTASFKWHAWWRCQGCHSHLLSWKGPTSKTDCRHADDTWIDCATWTGKECRSIHVCEVAAESASFMCKGLDEFLDYGPLKLLTLSLWGTSSSESAVFRCHCTAGCSSLQKCVVETDGRNNRAFVSK